MPIAYILHCLHGYTKQGPIRGNPIPCYYTKISNILSTRLIYIHQALYWVSNGLLEPGHTLWTYQAGMIFCLLSANKRGQGMGEIKVVGHTGLHARVHVPTHIYTQS